VKVPISSFLAPQGVRFEGPGGSGGHLGPPPPRRSSRRIFRMGPDSNLLSEWSRASSVSRGRFQSRPAASGVCRSGVKITARSMKFLKSRMFRAKEIVVSAPSWTPGLCHSAFHSRARIPVRKNSASKRNVSSPVRSRSGGISTMGKGTLSGNKGSCENSLSEPFARDFDWGSPRRKVAR